MADEIRVTAYLEAIKSLYQFPRIGGSFTFDLNGDGGDAPGFVDADITETVVDLSALTRPGWVFMQNFDPTNYVDWGAGPNLGAGTGLTPGTGTFDDLLIGRMYPGEPALFRLHPHANLVLRADTAPCRVLVKALED